MSKAFDTVNHQIPLDKLQHYDIRGVAFNWFSDYLKNRQQFAKFNDIHSSRNSIKCGVPQGSILGPLLFLIYINIMCYLSKVLDFILFADDTNIFFSCPANKLSTNFKKSTFMVFKPRQKRQVFDINLKISQCAIKRVNETIFLGVILNENLTWKPHIAINVARKISKSIGIIYKASFCFPTSSLCTLYYSLVYPDIQFLHIRGSTYPSNLNRIFFFTSEKSLLKESYQEAPSMLILNLCLSNLKY